MGIEFSEMRCVPCCRVSRVLGQDQQRSLGELGVTRCPGAMTSGLCSLPGEIIDNVAVHHPVPESMILDAAAAIVNGEISPTDIPQPAACREEAIARWGALLIRLDEIRYPDQHFNIAEKLPQ